MIVAFLFVLFHGILKYITKRQALLYLISILSSACIFYLFPVIRKLLLIFFMIFFAITYLQGFKPFEKITFHERIKKNFFFSIENTEPIANFLNMFHVWINFYISDFMFTSFAYFSNIGGFIYIFLSCVYLNVGKNLDIYDALIFLSILYLCFIASFAKFLYNSSSSLVWDVLSRDPEKPNTEKLNHYLELFGIPNNDDPHQNTNSSKTYYTYYNEYHINKFAARCTQYQKVELAVGGATLVFTGYYAHSTNVSAQAAVLANQIKEKEVMALEQEVMAMEKELRLKEVEMGIITEADYKKDMPVTGKK